MPDHEPHHPNPESKPDNEALREVARKFVEVMDAIPAAEDAVVQRALGDELYGRWAAVYRDADTFRTMTNVEAQAYSDEVINDRAGIFAAHDQVTDALFNWAEAKPHNMSLSYGAPMGIHISLGQVPDHPDGLVSQTLDVVVRDGVLVGDYGSMSIEPSTLQPSEREAIRDLERSLGENGQPLSEPEATRYVQIATVYRDKLAELAKLDQSAVRSKLGLDDGS